MKLIYRTELSDKIYNAYLNNEYDLKQVETVTNECIETYDKLFIYKKSDICQVVGEKTNKYYAENVRKSKREYFIDEFKKILVIIKN